MTKAAVFRRCELSPTRLPTPSASRQARSVRQTIRGRSRALSGPYAAGRTSFAFCSSARNMSKYQPAWPPLGRRRGDNTCPSCIQPFCPLFRWDQTCTSCRTCKCLMLSLASPTSNMHVHRPHIQRWGTGSGEGPDVCLLVVLMAPLGAAARTVLLLGTEDAVGEMKCHALHRTKCSPPSIGGGRDGIMLANQPTRNGGA